MTFDSESELQKIRRIADQQREKDVQIVEVWYGFYSPLSPLIRRGYLFSLA